MNISTKACFCSVHPCSHGLHGLVLCTLLITLLTRSAHAQLVEIRIAPSDLVGNPIVKIGPSQPFFLNMVATDLRPTPQGIFSVYSDIVYDDPFFIPSGAIRFATDFGWVRTGGLAVPGLIDEAGAVFASTSPPPPGVGGQLIFRLPMVSGPLMGVGRFDATAADVSTSKVTIFGSNFEVEESDIRFVGSPLIVGNGKTPDFNLDGDLDCHDIHALMTQINQSGNLEPFDLTGDGFVDEFDRRVWLGEAGAYRVGQGVELIPGDVTLDGFVDSRDLGIVLNAFARSGDWTWCQGDLDGDAQINSRDLGRILNDFGATPMVANAVVVPEPVFATVLLVCFLLGCHPFRQCDRPDDNTEHFRDRKIN